MQTLKFQCEYCRNAVMVGSDLAGTKVRCPHCRRIITAPAATPPASPHPPAVALQSPAPPPTVTLSPVPAPTGSAPVVKVSAAVESTPPAVSASAQGAENKIHFQCEQCLKPMRVGGDLAGLKVRCPHCRRVIIAPSAPAAPQSAPVAEVIGPAPGATPVTKRPEPSDAGLSETPPRGLPTPAASAANVKAASGPLAETPARGMPIISVTAPAAPPAEPPTPPPKKRSYKTPVPKPTPESSPSKKPEVMVNQLPDELPDHRPVPANDPAAQATAAGSVDLSESRVHFHCEHCHQPVRISTDLVGMKVRCPHCRRVVTAPAAAELSGRLSETPARGMAVISVPPPAPSEPVASASVPAPDQAEIKRSADIFEDSPKLIGSSVRLKSRGEAAPASPKKEPAEAGRSADIFEDSPKLTGSSVRLKSPGEAGPAVPGAPPKNAEAGRSADIFEDSPKKTGSSSVRLKPRSEAAPAPAEPARPPEDMPAPAPKTMPHIEFTGSLFDDLTARGEEAPAALKPTPRPAPFRGPSAPEEVSGYRKYLAKALIPYAVLITLLALYFFYKYMTAPHPFEILNDPGAPPARPVSQTTELPAKLRVPLNQPIRVGEIEVLPLGVEQKRLIFGCRSKTDSPQRATGESLVLNLQLTNVSQQNMEFRPLDIAFDYRWKEGRDPADAMPYTFLEAPNEKRYCGPLEWNRLAASGKVQVTFVLDGKPTPAITAIISDPELRSALQAAGHEVRERSIKDDLGDFKDHVKKLEPPILVLQNTIGNVLYAGPLQSVQQVRSEVEKASADSTLPDKYVAGTEGNAKVLKPGETIRTLVATDPNDQVPTALQGYRGRFLWRIQVRRGFIKSGNREYPATAVIGVEFDKDEIVQK